MAPIRDLVDVDDDVEEKRRLDRARVFVRTPWKPLIHHSVVVKVGEEIHSAYLVEENANFEGTNVRHHRRDMGSSEDIPSDDSDPDTPYSRWSARSTGFQHSGSALARWTDNASTEDQGFFDPLGKDQGGLAQSSRADRFVTAVGRCHLPDSAAQPRGDEDAIC